MHGYEIMEVSCTLAALMNFSMKKINSLVLIGSAFLLFSGCKKDDDDVQTTSCRIVTADAIEANDSSRIVVTYNGDGHVATTSQGATYPHLHTPATPCA